MHRWRKPELQNLVILNFHCSSQQQSATNHCFCCWQWSAWWTYRRISYPSKLQTSKWNHYVYLTCQCIFHPTLLPFLASTWLFGHRIQWMLASLVMLSIAKQTQKMGIKRGRQIPVSRRPFSFFFFEFKGNCPPPMGFWIGLRNWADSIYY